MIVIADDSLRERVDRFFHWPMIVLALLILPLLAVEFWAPPARGTWLWWASGIALAVIWMAFFVEFVIKIAIAECRIEYVRRNWLDVVILCLPALRPLRVGYLARTTRVFTLRGVGMKFLRYAFTLVVGLEATERMLERVGLRSKDGRPDAREMTRARLIEEVTELRREVDAWRRWASELERTEREGAPTGRAGEGEIEGTGDGETGGPGGVGEVGGVRG